MKWIKASERLPEDCKEVFVKNNGLLHILCHELDRWYNPNEGHVYLSYNDDERNNIEWLDEENQSVTPQQITDDDEYNRGYGDGYNDAVKEAREEIKQNYHPND